MSTCGQELIAGS